MRIPWPRTHASASDERAPGSTLGVSSGERARRIIQDAGRTGEAVTAGRVLRRVRRVAVVSFIVLAFGLISAGDALAHNTLTGSTPADGSVVSTSPPEVTLTFNDVVQNLQPLIAVTGPGGHHWEGSRVRVVNNTVSVPVNPLGPAGIYTVAYRIISADGHAVEGATTVSLSDAGTGTPNPDIPGSAGATNGIPAWVWILGAVVVLLAVVIVGFISSRRRVREAS